MTSKLAAVVGCVAALALTPAVAAAKLPVRFDALTFVRGFADGDTPPGSNDWSCRPTARHPRPVVLVHGSAVNAGANWGTFSPLLRNEGFCVFALTAATASSAGRAS